MSKVPLTIRFRRLTEITNRILTPISEIRYVTPLQF
jgi:hypothetical protein